MSSLVSVLLILLILLYLFVAGALFIGMLQDYPNDSFGERVGTVSVCIIWPVCLVLAGVIMVVIKIGR